MATLSFVSRSCGKYRDILITPFSRPWRPLRERGLEASAQVMQRHLLLIPSLACIELRDPRQGVSQSVHRINQMVEVWETRWRRAMYTLYYWNQPSECCLDPAEKPLEHAFLSEFNYEHIPGCHWCPTISDSAMDLDLCRQIPQKSFTTRTEQCSFKEVIGIVHGSQTCDESWIKCRWGSLLGHHK